MGTYKHNEAVTEFGPAINIWKNSVPAPPNQPYIIKKQINRYDFKVSSRGLLVPGYIDGKMVTILTIPNNGGKKLFLKDSSVSGSFYKFGDITEDKIFIAEGIATAATIHEYNKHCVYCAFTCHNLKKVAMYLRDKYPDAEITICADDDYMTEGNPGKRYAIEAAEAARAAYTLPDFSGLNRGPKDTDFNDLLRLLKEQSNEF